MLKLCCILCHHMFQIILSEIFGGLIEAKVYDDLKEMGIGLIGYTVYLINLKDLGFVALSSAD